MALLKLPVKFIAFFFMLIFSVAYLLLKAVLYLGAYAVSPFVILLIGLMIFTLVTRQWTNLLILGVALATGFLILFGATWLCSEIEGLKDKLSGFVRS